MLIRTENNHYLQPLNVMGCQFPDCAGLNQTDDLICRERHFPGEQQLVTEERRNRVNGCCACEVVKL